MYRVKAGKKKATVKGRNTKKATIIIGITQKKASQ